MRQDGTIGILTGPYGGVCDELQAWLDTLMYRHDEYRVKICRMKGNQIAAQRNRVVEQIFGDWLLFVDGDMKPPIHALDRLLAHDVPIIGATMTTRFPPFEVCAIKSLEPYALWTREELHARIVEQQRSENDVQPLPAIAVGTGCMLIRRKVFDQMDYPWFRCGQLDPEFLTEDTEFCLRASEHGYQTWIDPHVQVGHAFKGFVYMGADGELWIEFSGPMPSQRHLSDVRWTTVADGVHGAP